MITIFGYVPAFGVPDISPYVTTLIYWLKINKIPFEYKNQDLGQLDVDSPYGKLPYIVDSDDDTKVGDSNLIIKYLTKKHNITIDQDLNATERSISVAFDRLVGEHLYWSGVIQPRWRMDEGWETYIPLIVHGAPVSPELRAVLDGFRQRILDGFNGQGMGRRDEDCVLEFYKADIDALSDFLGEKKYLMGEKVHTIDARVHSMLSHLTQQPMKWKGTGYIESKKNLVAYKERMQSELGL
jgi:isoprene-epoxide---glutathione S-transferase